MPKYANQKTLTINKAKIDSTFLQIQDIDWMYAANHLSPAAFKIYLYLCGNKDKYRLDYSPQAIANTGIMSKSTASECRKELEAKGFIINGEFYERPPAHQQEIEARLNDTSPNGI